MKLKKIFLYTILTTSLVANCLFIYNTTKNSSVLKIDGKSILNNKEMIEKLISSYKINIIAEEMDKGLIKKFSEDKNIKNPNESDLNNVLSTFPSLCRYDENISDENREKLSEIYYINQIFKNSNVNDEVVKKFLKENMNITNPKFYKVIFYETDSHEKAIEVEKLLKDKYTIKEIEVKYKIKFDETSTISMKNLLDDKEEKDYKLGDVYHIMENNKMVVAQITDIENFEQAKDVFYNIYFSKNYTTIKTDLINKLKGIYKIEY